VERHAPGRHEAIIMIGRRRPRSYKCYALIRLRPTGTRQTYSAGVDVRADLGLEHRSARTSHAAWAPSPSRATPSAPIAAMPR